MNRSAVSPCAGGTSVFPQALVLAACLLNADGGDGASGGPGDAPGPARAVPAQGGADIGGHRGLAAETGAYKCCGGLMRTGGLHPARPGAAITARPARALSRSLAPARPGGGIISAADSALILANKGSGPSATATPRAPPASSPGGGLNGELPTE